MEKKSSKHYKTYIHLRNYSQKHLPFNWLQKIGVKNISREQLSFILSSFLLIVVLAVIALVPSYFLKSYPDKTPFYTVFLAFVAISAWYGGLKNGLFTTGILAIGAFILFGFPTYQYGLSFGLFLEIIVFTASAILISALINLARQSSDIRKLKHQEKVYAQTFIKLHGDYEKACDEIKARDEFLSLASHELKTPLATMLLKLHNMLNSIRSVSLANFSVPELMRVIKSAEEQINSLTIIVNNLLNVSLIRTGRIRLNIEMVNLTQITKQVAQNFSELLKREKYKLEIETKSPTIGNWDKVKIEEVVTNLLSNAIRYGRSRPIAITILNNERVGKFIIEDRGIGILQKDQKVIFDLFHRGASSDGYNNGLGVGLYITSQIVKMHGGTIKVFSEPMSGSKFTVELPLNRGNIANNSFTQS